jgi:hypothetical protein
MEVRMKPKATRPRRRFAGVGIIPALFWAALFAAACGQAPLYYSNQNQYLLHGLKIAGRGDLAHDWLANTVDPTPIFSAGIAYAYTYAGEWAFFAINAVLQSIYFVSLIALIDATFGLPQSRPARFVLLTLLVAVHSIAARWASLYVTGTALPLYLNWHTTAVDIPRLLHHGVAGQYLFGQGLQPSTIGVLLVTSMAAFARGRLIFAAVFAALACTVHPTYMLAAAMLTLAYMMVLLGRRRWFAAIFVGAVTLLAVAPIIYYSWTTFEPTNSNDHAAALRLLVDTRIPHHAAVGQWFDKMARLQVTWIAVGMLASLRTRLFPLLTIPAICAVLLTLAQMAPDNPAVIEWLRARGVEQTILAKLPDYGKMLALMFPWRISVVLVPVATTAILTRMVAMITPYPGRSVWLGRLARFPAAILLAAVVAGGLYITFREPGLMYPTDSAELPIMEFVRNHRQTGDVYLIPIKDLERFRLFTGAAIFVDWKAIPYKDMDVLEWRRRIEQAQHWYANNDWDTVSKEMQGEKVTHVVIPAANAPAMPKALEREFADSTYQLHRVLP